MTLTDIARCMGTDAELCKTCSRLATLDYYGWWIGAQEKEGQCENWCYEQQRIQIEVKKNDTTL